MLSHGQLKWNRPTTNQLFQLRAISGSISSEDEQRTQDDVVKGLKDTVLESKHPISKLEGVISAFPPIVFVKTSWRK